MLDTPVDLNMAYVLLQTVFPFVCVVPTAVCVFTTSYLSRVGLEDEVAAAASMADLSAFIQPSSPIGLSVQEVCALAASPSGCAGANSAVVYCRGMRK